MIIDEFNISLYIQYFFIYSKGPRLDYNDLLRISSEEPVGSLPAAPTTVLQWQPQAIGMPTSTTNPQRQEQVARTTTTVTTSSQNCQVAFLSTEERVRYADKLLNTCNNCEARISSYCFPRCFMSESDTKQFYCLNGNGGRNCFLDKHEPNQPDNRIPVRGTFGRCHKCKKGQSRFSCNKCENRFCLLNANGCFYSNEHLDNCD